MKLHPEPFRHGLLRVLAALSLAPPILFTPLPVKAAPNLDARHHRQAPPPDTTLEDVQAREAQKQVFGSHDGHVTLPTPQDLTHYQEAESRAEADRPLFPSHSRRDHHHHQNHHKRHKH